MMEFLANYIMRMEEKFSKETEVLKQQNQAIQNSIVQLERKSRFQPRGDPNWNNSKIVQKSQKFPNPIGRNNVVEKEDLNWCNPSSQPHSQDSCMYAKEISQMENEFNNEGTNDLNNFVGDYPNIANNIDGIDQDAIKRINQPKPSKEEIK
jgi:hypothetical protein